MNERMRTSVKQYHTMVEFMERNGDLLRPVDGNQGRPRAERQWLELADILNSDESGTSKGIDKWKKVWSDYKNKTKMKAFKFNKEMQSFNGEIPVRTPLSPLEQRVLSVMGIGLVVATVGTDEVVAAPITGTEDLQIPIEFVEENSLGSSSENEQNLSPSVATSPSISHSSAKKFRKTEPNPIEILSRQNDEWVKETQNRQCDEEENGTDENGFDHFGKIVACQLKKLPESLALKSMTSIQTYLVRQRLKLSK